MNQLQVVKASIHQNSQIVLSLGDFNKNQQVLELLKNFLLDYKNIEIFRSIILEDVNPQTIFVLYSLLQTIIKNGDHFYNFPNFDGKNNEQYFYNEFENRSNITNLCTFHIDVALTYLKRQFDHPTYVYNQVIFTVALLLRKYWIEINRIEELIFQIIQSTKFQYQQIFFNLFDNLVSCIRQYQYANGYIEFRKTMSSFSASSLQRIIEATLIEIQQLGQCSILQIYQNNKAYATSFIGLLYQILNVNFNLSYYEIDFDSENRGDTSQLTNFPDYYFELITNTNFLKEMFCSTISFLKIDQNLSLQCINILQRIACIRLSIFHKKKCKGAFRKQLWEGLLYLYQNQDQFIIYPDFSYEIHSLSIRIINNLTLRKLHKFSDLFEQCFLLLSNVYTKTIQIYGMKVITNNPCTKIQELWNQIGYQVSLHRNQNDDLNQRVNQVMQNHLTIVLNAFFSQISFSEVPQDLSPKKFKKMIALLFLPYQYLFKLKLLDNLQSLMMMIQQLKMNYCEYKCAALICLAQSFLLYIQASDNFNFGFDSYQFTPKEENRPNTDLKASVLKYVIEVIINPQIPKTTKILQMASLNFIESFTNATLDSLCYDKEQKILKNLSQLYGELIRIDLNYQNYLFILEKILEECFQVFTCTDPTLIEYSLKLIEFIYSKVKRLLPRNVFRNCGITSMLKQFFLQLNITCLDNPRYIKKRALIFKIIAIVWIDDCSDEYVSSIVEIYSQIKKNIFNEMNKESMLKYIWDLIGIASEIDNDLIYRTFLRVIYPDLSKILTPENIQIFVKDYDSSIAILTLLRAIFYNKNTRIQTENILLILYQIYGSAINFFIILMKMQIQEAKQTQKLSDNQIKQVHKLMAVMSQISNSKIFNQGFFIIYNDLTLLELFKQQIQLIYIYRPLLIHIPKYKKELYELLDNICQEHPETLAYKCEATIYIEIFSICKETLNEVIKDNQGDDSINENCSTLIQIGSLLSNISTFLIQEASVGHQNDTIMIQNKIQQIIQQGKNILFEIFSLSCQISSIYPKNSKILYIIPEILYGVSIFCPLEFEQLLVQIISNQVGINQNFTDLMSLAFKNLQCELKISGKEDFIKKIKQILEVYK